MEDKTQSRIKPQINGDHETWQDVMKTVEDRRIELGPYFSFQINNNIRHLLFVFSRYKFAAQMIGEEPKKSVLELGCSEGVGTLILAQVASTVKAVDFDEQTLAWAKGALSDRNIEFICDDFLGKRFGEFDAVVSLDVIEHINSEKEDLFLQTLVMNLNDEGTAIIGTPNIAASAYASEASRIGHINLYDQQRLKNLLLKGFKNVYIFGMNDEVLHTGFHPMCHYIFALACNKR